MASIYERALAAHEEWEGKIEMAGKIPVATAEDLALAYTPGVAEPCRRISRKKNDVYKYTWKSNVVAVVTDGSAVLGLGDIGPEASLPVMEGKALLFKEFAGVNAVPICLDTQDTEEIISLVKNIAPSFGGINLEDISAPRCVEIEERLTRELDIPVFHDDQHGTAIVVLAALINALKLVDKKAEDVRAVLSGAGAAGSAIAKMLHYYGIKDMILFDKEGAVSRASAKDSDPLKQSLAELTDVDSYDGTLADALKGADLFIGVSAPNLVTKEMAASMNEKAIVFAMANPEPEISYQEAIEAGAVIAGTGRSDSPNQINNVLAFPGLFKGALSIGATKITRGMQIAAAKAIAGCVSEEELKENHIIPSPLDKSVAEKISAAVQTVAIEEKVVRLNWS